MVNKAIDFIRMSRSVVLSKRILILKQTKCYAISKKKKKKLIWLTIFQRSGTIQFEQGGKWCCMFYSDISYIFVFACSKLCIFQYFLIWFYGKYQFHNIWTKKIWLYPHFFLNEQWVLMAKFSFFHHFWCSYFSQYIFFIQHNSFDNRW